MGGHAAWRKRVKNGDLAKGSGGAICRHRPHFNRGKPILKKGQLRGGNPKKKKKGKYGVELDKSDNEEIDESSNNSSSIATTTTMNSMLTKLTTIVILTFLIKWVIF